MRTLQPKSKVIIACISRTEPYLQEYPVISALPVILRGSCAVCLTVTIRLSFAGCGLVIG